VGSGTERTNKARALGIRDALYDYRPAGFAQFVQHRFWRRDQAGWFHDRLDGCVLDRCTLYDSLAAALHSSGKTRRARPAG
jgi:hypothetical protein